MNIRFQNYNISVFDLNSKDLDGGNQIFHSLSEYAVSSTFDFNCKFLVCFLGVLKASNQRFRSETEYMGFSRF